jgi:hypothetical protein
MNNEYEIRNVPDEYFEKMMDEPKESYQKRSSPAWKNSSTKSGRSAKQIKKDRKRNKMK